MLPTRNAMEAQGAGMTTAAQEQARIAAEFGAYDEMTRKVAERASAEARATAAAEADATAAKKSVDSLDTLGLLDVAEGLVRSEEHTSELQSLMRSSYAVFCLKKKNKYQPLA